MWMVCHLQGLLMKQNGSSQHKICSHCVNSGLPTDSGCPVRQMCMLRNILACSMYAAFCCVEVIQVGSSLRVGIAKIFTVWPLRQMQEYLVVHCRLISCVSTVPHSTLAFDSCKLIPAGTRYPPIQCRFAQTARSFVHKS